MVIKLVYGVEKKKVDEQGRFVLPSDWRAEELKESKEVFVIKGKGYLKIVPKKKIDLTKFFDSADLGMNIEDWDDFERRFYNEIP
jgi:bifunctional DNA-binding transcriptional regulator/antitoxin component of YhaV-PrlF toxin-antitoxin module